MNQKKDTELSIAWRDAPFVWLANAILLLTTKRYRSNVRSAIEIGTFVAIDKESFDFVIDRAKKLNYTY